MKMMNTAVLLSLGLLAISGCSRQEEPKLSEPIRKELDKFVAGMACMPSRAFPLEENANSFCVDCNKLVDAGLIRKESSADSTTEGYAKSPASVHYYLTDIGESAYVQGESSSFGPDGPRFCFGSPHLTQITRTYGPVIMNGARNFSIRYIVQLDDPNPYLFDPRAKLLGIRLPDPVMEGKPVFYPEQNITAVINQNNPDDFYLDSSMTFGPIGEKL